jgi:hypothetical protein
MVGAEPVGLVGALPVHAGDVGDDAVRRPLDLAGEVAGARGGVDGATGTNGGVGVRVMDPESVKQQFLAEMAAWAEQNAVGEPVDDAEQIRVVGEVFMRHGVPVTNGRVEDDAIVFDVVVPRGQG